MSGIPIVDPHRVLIQQATGPMHVDIAPETFVVTFTQMSPSIEKPGTTEAVVISRIAMSREKFEAFFEQCRKQQLVR
jgi:hypothetical protein